MKHTYILMAMGVCLMASCSNQSSDYKTMVSEDCLTDVVMSIDDFQFDEGTRTSISPNGEFLWSKGDQIGVWPTMSQDEGIASQVLFQAASGNANSVKFNGSGWGLVPNRLYYAYYPYQEDATANKVVAVYSNSLNQVAINSTAHLSVNDFMYTSTTTPEAGNTAQFQFHHFGSLAKIDITLPDVENTGYLRTVIITASEPVFPVEMEYNPTSLEPEPTVLSYTETQTITLGKDSKGLALDKNNSISVYLLIGATDLTGKTLQVDAFDGRNSFSGIFNGGNQQSGHGRKYAIDVYRMNPDNTVDLGLPSGKYWAASNLTVNGLAQKESDFGDYYGWGELEPYYTSLTVKGEGDITVTWKDGYDGYTQASYDKNTQRGQYSSGYLGEADDAAAQTLGGCWRMPTVIELNELDANCTAAGSTMNGVPGVLLTSKINGNTMFIPSTGYISGTTFKGYTSSSPGARFWLLDCNNETTALQQLYSSSSPKLEYGTPKDKFRGTPIRPIYVPID